ncbi:MAG TPA: ERAP1-like C-terminal domain-containing protein, partial [Candidatus Saccharimonadales bacterium]
PHQPSDKLWPTPLNASDPQLPSLLTEKEVSIPYKSETPLRLNVGDSAHFITHYDTALFARRVEELKSNTLTPLDRVQLLHEQTLLARGGIVPTAILIPLLDAYKNEDTEPVWDMISLAINELKKFIEADAEAEQKLRALAGNLARAQYERLGWEPQPNETESQAKLRTTIISLMVYGEDATVLETAKQTYDTHKLEDLNPELRPLIIGAVVRHYPSEQLITNLIEAYASTSSSDLQQDIASGLTSTKDPAVITRLLSLITDAKTVRPQDATHWFVWLIRNRNGRALTWKWLRDNWGWIETTFGSDKSYDDFPRYAATALVTDEQLQEYKSFFTPLQKEPALTRVISIGISEIEGRIELIKRDSPAVLQALRNL